MNNTESDVNNYGAVFIAVPLFFNNMKKDTDFSDASLYVNYIINKLKIKPISINSTHDIGYIRVKVRRVNTLHRLAALVNREVLEANKTTNHYCIDFWYKHKTENILITFYTSNLK